jgi:hypothetical protein
MVKSLIRGIAKWPTADIAELLLALKDILDSRAEHARETKQRSQSKRVDRRPAK